MSRVCFAGLPRLKGIAMSAYDQIRERFEQKSPFAVLVRVILQRPLRVANSPFVFLIVLISALMGVNVFDVLRERHPPS